MNLVSKKIQYLIIRNVSTKVHQHRNKIMRMIYLKVHPDLFHNHNFKDAKVNNFIIYPTKIFFSSFFPAN
jgi:hypothetical protein